MFKLNSAQRLILPLTTVVLIALTGCNSESSSSEDIRTQGIWAKMDVDGQPDGRSRVVVELNVGGEFGTNVELTEDEYLEVSANGETVRLSEDNDLFDIDYQTYIDTIESNTEFNIRFYRSNGEAIVNSTGNLPEAFEITAPQSTEVFSRQDILTLAWTPAQSAGSINFIATLSCPTIGGGSTSSANYVTIQDSGEYQYTIANHSIFDGTTPNLDTSAQCDMSLTLRRLGTGTIDSAFDSGSEFSTSQTRRIRNLKLNQ